MAQTFLTGMQTPYPLPIQPRGSGLGQNAFGGPDYPPVEPIRVDLEMRISALETEIRKLKKESIGYLKISTLPNKRLCVPLDVVVEADGDKFIARTVDLSLYGNGEDPIEAIEMLKREVESLYDNLMSGDDFSGDWLRIKRFLAEIITD